MTENVKKQNGEPVEEPRSSEMPEISKEAIPDPVTQELEKVQKELLYLRAEFENYKKRILKEQEQAIRFANEKLIGELLSVSDHFERALLAASILKSKAVNPELAQVVDGIEMTQKELTQCLRRFGVEFIGGVNEKFDPALYEAVSQKPVSESMENKVLEVVNRGCLLHGRLLKPARVVVGVATPKPAP